MTDKEQLILNYRDFMSKPLEVFEIFKDYFGEERVDFQGVLSEDEFIHEMEAAPELDQESVIGDPFILVWFPFVTVTNENNKSVMIQDLYAEVRLDFAGLLRGKPRFNRSTYTYEQWISDYLHSHCPGINKRESDTFLQPCTGIGPINGTISSLLCDFDADLWMLFCSELDDFTQVESISGTPYRYLEHISGKSLQPVDNYYYFVSRGRYCTVNQYPNSLRLMMRDFTRYFLKLADLRFEFAGNSYSIGMPFKEFMIMLNNTFIHWFNHNDNPYRRVLSIELLKDWGILVPYIIKDNMLYTVEEVDAPSSIEEHNGKPMFRFKGATVTLKISDSSEFSGNEIIALELNIVQSIASAILKTVNLKYGRTRENQKDFSLSSGEAYYI